MCAVMQTGVVPTSLMARASVCVRPANPFSVSSYMKPGDPEMPALVTGKPKEFDIEMLSDTEGKIKVGEDADTFTHRVGVAEENSLSNAKQGFFVANKPLPDVPWKRTLKETFLNGLSKVSPWAADSIRARSLRHRVEEEVFAYWAQTPGLEWTQGSLSRQNSNHSGLSRSDSIRSNHPVINISEIEDRRSMASFIARPMLHKILNPITQVQQDKWIKGLEPFLDAWKDKTGIKSDARLKKIFKRPSTKRLVYGMAEQIDWGTLQNVEAFYKALASNDKKVWRFSSPWLHWRTRSESVNNVLNKVLQVTANQKASDHIVGALSAWHQRSWKDKARHLFNKDTGNEKKQTCISLTDALLQAGILNEVQKIAIYGSWSLDSVLLSKDKKTA